MSTHNYLDKTGLGQVWDKIKALITQSNWEEDTSSDSAYILNKPSIKSGDGENSVLVGQIEQNSTSEIYTLYLTGAANATTFTYTTDATLPNDSAATLTKWVLRYDNGNVKNFRNVVSIDQTNNLITLESKLSSTATLTNAEVLLYYNYKIAFGKNSYAEGANTFAADNMTHAEGNTTKALGLGSHTEGIYTIATGGYSHSEGSYSKASGGFSHAEGQYTIAASSYQHVQGKCNIEDSNNVYAHIVGNGSSKNARSNAHTLDWNGNGWYAGKVSAGTVANPANPTAANDLVTKAYVDANIDGAGTLVVHITDGQDEGTYESDKTFLEIGEAITEGKDIKCIYWNNIYYLVYNNNDGFLQFQNRINIGVDDPQYSDINDIYFNIIQIDIFNNTISVFQTRCEVPLPSITTPLMNGTSSIGNSEKYAKADHVHPSDTTRAAVADVLTKTNTTSYTPTSDYHPATKKYVDDNVGSIDFSNYLAKNNTTSYTPTANYHPATKKYVDDSIPTVPTKVSDLTNDSGFITSYTETDPIFLASAAHGITSTDISNWNGKANSSDILTKTNTTSYTPTADYHPATKKYVDDKSVMVVNITSSYNSTDMTTTYHADKNFVEMYEHFVNDDGLLVAMDDNGSCFWLSEVPYVETENGEITYGEIQFCSSGVGDGYASSYGYYVYFDNTIECINNQTARIAVYNATNDQVLMYDSNTFAWVNRSIPASSLSELTDTIISSPSDGQLLKYNATTSKWENVTLSLAISNNTIQLKEGNTVLSSVNLPIYNGGVSS